MSRRKLYSLIVPIATFVLGILVQVLASQWITLTNIVPISLITIMVVLLVIFIILELIDRRFEILDTQLLDIANRIGLKVEYIDDGTEGKSYKETTRLIENAKFSLISVGNWEPFPAYQQHTDTSKTTTFEKAEARKRYYMSIQEKIEQHKHDGKPFHRRIVQVPETYTNSRIPFETDPVFNDYLIFMAEMNSFSPRTCCVLRKTTSYIQNHFTLVDDRFIIIPILTTIKNRKQARYGAIIIDDTQGELAKRLETIYWDIENRSSSIEIKDLKKI